MKYFLVLVLAVVGALAAPRADDDDAIPRIQAFAKRLVALVSEPALDYHGKGGILDLELEKVELSSYDVVLSGIKGLDVSNMVYNEEAEHIEYEWVFPSIEADIEFDLKLSGLLKLDHNPVVKITLNNLKLVGYLVVVPGSNPIVLSDLKLSFALDSADVSLKRILDNAILSKTLEIVLNKELPTLVSDVSAKLEPIISPVARILTNVIVQILA